MTKKVNQLKNARKEEMQNGWANRNYFNHFTTSVHTTGHNSSPHGLKFLKCQTL